MSPPSLKLVPLICGLCGQPLSACRCWREAERRGTLIHAGLAILFTVALVAATLITLYALLLYS